MKGLRYVIALFHVALIARANIENNNPGIIIVIMSAPVIIVNVIKSTIVIIVGQPALNTIIVIKMFDSSSFHLSVLDINANFQKTKIGGRTKAGEGFRDLLL